MISGLLLLLTSFLGLAYARPSGKGVLSRNLSSAKPPHEATCPEQFPPTTFALASIQYIKIEYVLYTPDLHGPNSTQMAFEATNAANGVSTGCSFMRVMMANGEYPDDSKDWHPCLDRSLDVDGQEAAVATSARFDWNTWDLAVNQSWTCGNG